MNSQNIHITPKPQKVVFLEEGFQINAATQIVFLEEAKSTALQLQEFLQQHFGILAQTTNYQHLKKNFIHFKTDKSLTNEGYELNISSKNITICAKNSTGWFYGLQSLEQLCTNDGSYDRYEKSVKVPGLKIKDAPRFSWRAFMLDEARYFKGMKQVKMLLDEMAYLKMNVFHWHLTDDQGWRIEIKKYPKLTEIGSKRKSTQIGPMQWESPIQSGEPHEGFYTQEEIKEIIQYAQDRHITIVPEIEMPGHSTAAIAAYPWLGTSKKEQEVPIKFGVAKDVYDVADAKVLRFLTDVLDEVMALFPSEVIHIGGDEVKYNHWKASASVQKYMKEKQLATPADLQVYFTNNISAYIQSKGKRMMGWNEIMGHNLHHYQKSEDTQTSQKLAKQSIIHFWKGNIELATLAASNGYDIVNSLHNFTYLDYSYKNLSLSKAYRFDPVPKDLDEKYHDKIIGTGCQMWGEWIPTDGEMHYMVFPRIAAYAEIGWTEVENKDFTQFLQSVKHLRKRWEQKELYISPE